MAHPWRREESSEDSTKLEPGHEGNPAGGRHEPPGGRAHICPLDAPKKLLTPTFDPLAPADRRGLEHWVEKLGGGWNEQ